MSAGFSTSFEARDSEEKQKIYKNTHTSLVERVLFMFSALKYDMT